MSDRERSRAPRGREGPGPGRLDAGAGNPGV